METLGGNIGWNDVGLGQWIEVDEDVGWGCWMQTLGGNIVWKDVGLGHWTEVDGDVGRGDVAQGCRMGLWIGTLHRDTA